jgi:hypothetical protein
VNYGAFDDAPYDAVHDCPLMLLMLLNLADMLWHCHPRPCCRILLCNWRLNYFLQKEFIKSSCPKILYKFALNLLIGCLKVTYIIGLPVDDGGDVG